MEAGGDGERGHGREATEGSSAGRGGCSVEGNGGLLPEVCLQLLRRYQAAEIPRVDLSAMAHLAVGEARPVVQIEVGDGYRVPLSWDIDAVSESQNAAAAVKEGMALLMGHLSMPTVVCVA